MYNTKPNSNTRILPNQLLCPRCYFINASLQGAPPSSSVSLRELQKGAASVMKFCNFLNQDLLGIGGEMEEKKKHEKIGVFQFFTPQLSKNFCFGTPTSQF